MQILVVGGAGYIGSHMVKLLAQHGHGLTVLDNLTSGHSDAVLSGDLIVGDLSNLELLEQIFAAKSFDVVMHFASSILVGESVQDPAKYYRNNVSCTQYLLDAMVRHGVSRFVFSSTAAIFGEPIYVPIDESHPKNPINPYGRSKWMVEQILEDYERAYGLKSICLRYFNAAGADPDGELAERHDPETHLIPLVLEAASGRRKAIMIHGSDYDTLDGTCVRDYVHVSDLCEAHRLAISFLVDHNKSERFNLGNGKGFSVRKVIDTARAVTGRDICIESGGRREGDPAVLVADAKKAKDLLGWCPIYSDLSLIIKHAWQAKESGFLQLT